MSDALIQSQNAEIARLQRLVESLSAENKRRKERARELAKQVEELTPRLEASEKAAKDWQSRAESRPGEQADRIRDLEAQLRGRDVRDKIDSHVRSLKDVALADGVDVAKMMKAAGFDPSADGSESVDPAELVGRLRSSDPYLFKPLAATNAAVAPHGAQRPTLQVGVPVGRGESDKAAAAVTYTRDELKSPGWADRRPELKAALARGEALLRE